MQDRRIIVYNTHIEIYPYHLGDSYKLEKMLSKFDYVTHKWIPVAYYIEDNTLYIPRGVPTTMLYNIFNINPELSSLSNKYKQFDVGEPLYDAKSDIQKEAIDFLLGNDKFAYTKKRRQISLNLDTGDGKTYAALYAVCKLKVKTLVITHQDSIKKQWLESLENMTSIEMDRVCDISSVGMDYLMENDVSDDYDIYLVNHQTITAFANRNSWKDIKKFFEKYYIGIKITDEAHLFFENSLMIDYFSNVYKNIYLTATFQRSDKKENTIYNMSYTNVARYGEQTFDYESKRKHIVMVIVYFKSIPEIGQIVNVRTRRGFSVYRYIDYELNEENNTLMKVLFKLLKETERLEGKRLILVPKKSVIDLVYELVQDRYPDKTIGKIYSDNTEEENRLSKEKDIIIATAKSSGTGLDIKGLRILYDLEPIGSQGYADQVRGRLREYSPDKDTFFFYPVDTTIPDSLNMLQHILPVFKRKCKEIITMKVDDI